MNLQISNQQYWSLDITFTLLLGTQSKISFSAWITVLQIEEQGAQIWHKLDPFMRLFLKSFNLMKPMKLAGKLTSWNDAIQSYKSMIKLISAAIKFIETFIEQWKDAFKWRLGLSHDNLWQLLIVQFHGNRDQYITVHWVSGIKLVISLQLTLSQK